MTKNFLRKSPTKPHRHRAERIAEAFEIDCQRHGRSRGIVICIHLHDGTGRGFHDADPNEPETDAWCDACEILLNEAGCWGNLPDAIDRLKMVCTPCYRIVRANQLRHREIH